MFYATNNLGERVAADVAAGLPRVPYTCPICEKAVRLRAGTQRIAHYAHVSNKECDTFAHEMTPWHLGWQALFPEDEREYVLVAGGEKHRTDILHNDVAIEFQHSPISEKEFWRRCEFHTKATRHLVWVFDVRERWMAERIEELGGSAGEEHYRWHGHRPTFCGFRPKSQPRITLVLQFEGTDDGEGVDLCEVTNVAGEPEFSYFESYDSRIDEHPFPEWIDTILIPKLDRAAAPLIPIVPNIVTHRRKKSEMPNAEEGATFVEQPDLISSVAESDASAPSDTPSEPPAPPPQPPVETTPRPQYPADRCPACGAKMVLRKGQKMHSYFTLKWTELPPFWGCSNYPACTGKREVVLPKCPGCGTEMFVQVRHRDNVPYWRCPNCNRSMDAVLKP